MNPPSSRPRADLPDDGEFLALLVHHEFLDRARARALLERVESDEALGPVLEEALDRPPAAIARLRRTRCGEEPEVPGFELERRLGRGGSADV
ncbi:MAG: hypothetical protein ACYSWX_12445, partial [Planctomycetota bacterium]